MSTTDELRQIVEKLFPDRKPGFHALAVSVWHKFRFVVSRGDIILTYDPAHRVYLLGEVTGDYQFRPGLVPDHEQVRQVRWTATVKRDDLSPAVRNTLGSTLALFEPGDDVLEELRAKTESARATSARLPTVSGSGEEVTEGAAEPEPLNEIDRIRRDVLDRAHEFIKDRIAALDWVELQELVAAILRAMGYKTQISPAGPDRGKDIIASPDGLGLSPPRIKVEVKHRAREVMGAPEVRSFLGGLRGDDRGLYVSSGGFTREAQYEAERASMPVHLIDLDLLATLLVQHYEQLDSDGRALVPLVRFYWPANP